MLHPRNAIAATHLRYFIGTVVEADDIFLAEQAHLPATNSVITLLTPALRHPTSPPYATIFGVPDPDSAVKHKGHK